MRCKSVEPLLSEYIDERLSARRTLEVEGHLAECHACTRTLNELRRTVSLVQGSPALRVSEEFTAGLQARLQGLEPAPAPRAWLEGARALFRPRALPVWGAAAGLAALGIVLLIPRGEQLTPPRSPVETLAVGTASHQNVAISAADPFADIGAANLAAHASADSGGDGEIVF